MSVRRIVPDIRSKQLDTSRQFYVDVLGLEVAMDMAPSDHIEHKGYLRLRNLPVNQMANTVLVVKLEFDKLPEAGAQGTGGGSDLLRR